MKVHKWNDLKESKLSPDARARARTRADAEILEMNLATLRRELGVTQIEAAKESGLGQSELSRIERRDDHMLSTLRRYVAGLGGELEVYAVVGGRRVRLSGV